MSKPVLSVELKKAFRLITAPMRKLPDFIVAGAPKSYTSSFYDILTAHPNVRRAACKEPTNFIHYPTSEFRARMHQPFRFGKFLSGEGSVEYFAHPDAPMYAAAIVPHAKVFFLLRDPVARAWSDYRMFVRSGHEKEDFGTVVRRAIRWLSDSDAAPLCQSALRTSFNPLRYVYCGLYASLLERWWRYFPRGQTLVLISEDLDQKPEVVVETAYRFLGLPLWQPPHIPHARAGGENESPPNDVGAELRRFYQPFNARLSKLLGRFLPWHET